MSRVSKKNIKAIQELDVVSDLIKDNFFTLPITHLKQLQGLQTIIKREVLEILYNGSKERK